MYVDIFVALGMSLEGNAPKLENQQFVSGARVGAFEVEAMRYKPEGPVFDSWWCHRNVSLTSSFLPHYGPRGRLSV